MSVINGFCEKDLEDMIIENIDSISSRGLSIFYKNTERQVKIPLSGICDIVTWETVDNELFVRIIELKKGEIGFPALSQGLDYFECMNYNRVLFDKVNIELVLIGASISEELKYLKGLKIPNLSLYTYDFGYNGLVFTYYEPEVILKRENIESLKVEFATTYDIVMSFYKKLKQ